MGARILVADDSITIQKVVEFTLSKENVELVQAKTAAEALTKARTVRPDLILMDLSLPDTPGDEVCRTIRQDPQLKGIPIILLVGTFENVDEAQGRQFGANEIVSKPFDSQTLITKVKGLLTSRPGELRPGAEQAVPPSAEVRHAPAETAPPQTPTTQTPALELESPLEVGAGPQWELADLGSKEVDLESATPAYELSGEGIEGLDLGAPVDESGGGKDSGPPLEIEQTSDVAGMATSLGLGPGDTEAVPDTATPEPVFELEPSPTELQAHAASERTLTPPSEGRAVGAKPPSSRPTRGPAAPSSDLTDQVATRVVEELREKLIERIEQVVWEVVPDLAEHLINQEIERIKAAVKDKQ
ncbi:MAG: response regulator [Candidatus Methylomirabilales bacterium]